MVEKLVQKKFARNMLVSLYGINTCTANKLIGRLALHPQAKGVQLLRRKYSEPLGHFLNRLRIAFRLRLIIFSRICFQLSAGTYRGIRRLQGLPSKGQRTHANGNTARRFKISGNNFPFNLKGGQARAEAIKQTLNATKRHKGKTKLISLPTKNKNKKKNAKTKQKSKK
jgi:ribosomal protein S13